MSSEVVAETEGNAEPPTGQGGSADGSVEKTTGHGQRRVRTAVSVILVVVAWSAYRYISRVDAIRRALRDEMKRRQSPSAQSRTVQAEDLVKCRVCGAYVAARGATSCGRPDCPWR